MVNRRKKSGFTLIELLVVIAIVGTLAAVLFAAMGGLKEKSHAIVELNNMKEVTLGTLVWSDDNDQKLPSPQYPGGHTGNNQEYEIPDEWDFAGTGTGLWLDGVIYYVIYYKDQNERAADSGDTEVKGVDGANGKHLQNTVFASMQSYRKTGGGVPLPEVDWHRHSFAMNKSIQHDYIYEGTSDPELTNKSLSRIPFRPNALLFIENQESNVIGFEDRDAIIQTGEDRWRSKRIHASFLDGSVRKLKDSDIPAGDVENDRTASRFWRGVDPDSVSGN